MESQIAHCVACNGTLSLFGPRLKYEYHQCESCGTIQLFPLPSKTELVSAYVNEYATASHYEGDPASSRQSARPYYQAVISAMKEHKADGLIIDYGAGWGGLCELLIAEGYETQGLEPSGSMAAHCQSLGLPVHQGDLSTLSNLTGKVGVFALCAVFEHLVEHDTWLSQAHAMLIPGGLIITMQPTAQFANLVGRTLRLGSLRTPLPALYQVFCPPWHTVLFSLRGMKTLMEKHGFELIEVRPAPQGRLPGVKGLVQLLLQVVNRVGWSIMGQRWPLLIAHTFVLRKQSQTIDPPSPEALA